jgi:hypothetical protein
MSAQIVGLNGEMDADPGKEDDLSSLLVTGDQTQQTPAKDDTVTGDEVPEKYRDKTAKELLDIVTNQESLMGRQSTEIGELRNQNGTLRGSVDAALALRSPDSGRADTQEEDALTDTDFAADPVDATKRMVQRETQGLRDSQAKLDGQARAIQFDRDYPSAGEDVNDPEFLKFVQKSAGRTRLATSAFGDKDNVDYVAAEQLWDLYDDYKSLIPAPASQENTELNKDDNMDPNAQAPASQAPAAKPPKMVTGNSGDQGGTDGKSGKPVYSQSALNDLQNENPDKFWSDSVQKPLAAAYKEGRVLQDI